MPGLSFTRAPPQRPCFISPRAKHRQDGGGCRHREDLWSSELIFKGNRAKLNLESKSTEGNKVLHITRLKEQAQAAVFIRDLSPVLFFIQHMD